jgi:hypothetical protein
MVRPVSRLRLAVCLAVAVVAWLRPAPAAAQAAPTLDHFWCYIVQGQPIETPVLLRDQWTPAGALAPALVRNAVRFCNPVKKTTADGAVTDITNREAHLKMYLAHTPALGPALNVRVRNQFGGRQRLKVFDPIILGVPSAKDSETPPTGLDHFKCYRAYGGALRRRVVRLEDQFQAATVTVRRAVAFCNPTEKRHNTTVTPITNEKGHLVCYSVTPTSLPAPRTFFTDEQFAGGNLVTTGSDILCVPSEKVAFAPIL